MHTDYEVHELWSLNKLFIIHVKYQTLICTYIKIIKRYFMHSLGILTVETYKNIFSRNPKLLN